MPREVWQSVSPMQLTRDVQFFLDKRNSCIKCSLKNEVDDPVSKRALAFETAPLRAVTLNWHVISRAFEGVVVSDACVLTLALVFLPKFNSLSSRWSSVWCGLSHFVHISTAGHFLAMCPLRKQFMQNPCSFNKANLSS